MKILTTGGAGFIGSHLVKALIKQEQEVIVVDNLVSGNIKNLPLFTKFYKTDIRNFQELKNIFEKHKPEIIFHLAANIDLRKSIKNPIHDAEINILGSLNLLELAKQNNVKKFIFSSSGAVYGQNEIPSNEKQEPKPESPYGISKLTIEKYLDFYKKNYGLNYVALRYSNVYGPLQNPEGEAGVIGIFLDKMFKNINPKIFKDGLQTRDYIYVSDVVEANVLSLNQNAQGIYNVSTGKQTNVIEIFRLLNSFFNNKFKQEHIEKKEGEQKDSCLSYEKIKQELGWEFKTHLNQGIFKTYEWFINQSSQ